MDACDGTGAQMPAPAMMGARGDTNNPWAETRGPPAVVRPRQRLRLVYLHAARCRRPRLLPCKSFRWQPRRRSMRSLTSWPQMRESV